MSTWQLNERKKKIECHMKPKNQQENEDKKQQITLKEKKIKKKKNRREPGTVDGVLKVKIRR